ncbi:MAG: heavy-metal-associated domain-containing protein [Bacteroidales bacterium]|jgi:copper chaperone CopZ|nr:heavy-metal-associated domain-containing protein [Bacteroidales bacterium]
MKKTVKPILVITLLLVGFGKLQAQDVKTEAFKVYGNCGMCEARIEKAVKSIDGVASAEWDKKTKLIEVKYNPEKVELMDVHKAIAKVGHDTEKMEAKNEVYEQLPACCQYERKDTTNTDDEHHGHQH